MDSILTYHTNPLTCGVARFNKALGCQLGLPVHQMFSPEGLAAQRPLLSMKLSEFEPEDAARLGEAAVDPKIWPGLNLFFHDYSAAQPEARLLRRARRVYCANEFLVRELTPLHKDVVQAWCPGYLFDQRRFDADAEVRIYTFGMAHKLRVDYYYRLKELLDASGKRYSIYISAAIHEGTSLDDSFTAAYEELTTIFGERVYFLGFISDGALFNYLADCTYFVAFFQSGVRANNTSVNTVMQCGTAVLTNLDEASPSDFKHLESVVDIRQCGDALLLDKDRLVAIGNRGREVAARLGWPPLLDLFKSREADLKLG